MESRATRAARETASRRLRRAALFASTALVVPAAALAQSIGPDTTPQGGVVVAGSSTIAQAPGSTTINQSSQRTAIDWQSFNVGAAAKVQFNQPSTSAIALNRVTGGDLSVINGRIDANGQIVLINQSGVVFAKGSQVNAESVVVSTSDIATKNFMAGTMAFTGAPKPGAKIVNEGNITVKDTGLVGLVAPQVANAGVITARLGQVVLAGATAFTLDLYGDRLISLDVTQAVRAVDLGNKTVPALVTNSGVIIADGGHVTLTARQADALVTQLIDAGGTIRADTVGAQTGAISISGVGGNIAIAGNLLARGTAGGGGGTVEAMSTGTVAVASTAVLDVSGAAGGGAVALGTNLARATAGASDTAAPKAAAVTIAQGAAIHADATAHGNGGKVVLLSTQKTDFDGAISTQGGAQGGDGGIAEISSDGVISLGGSVLATAIDGKPGEILLDPATLIVINADVSSGSVVSGGTTTFGGTTGGGISFVRPAQIDSLSGNVILEAAQLVSVASAIDMTNASALSLVSLGNIEISAGITVNGSLSLDAGKALGIEGGLFADNIALKSGAAGTSIEALVSASNLLALSSAGTIDEKKLGLGQLTIAGTLDAATVTSDGGTIGGDALLTLTNTIATLAGFNVAAAHTLALHDTGLLTVAGPVVAPTATLSSGTIHIPGELTAATALILESPGNITGAGTVVAGALSSGGTTIGGNLALTGTSNAIAALDGVTVAAGHSFLLDDTGLLIVTGPLVAPSATLAADTIAVAGTISAANTLALQSTGNIAETGTIRAGTLTSGGAIGGNARLTGSNTIGVLAGFTVATGHTLALDDTGLLTIDGPLTAPTATLSAATLALDGAISAAGVLVLETPGSITETGAVRAGTLASGGTTIGGDALLTGTANSIGVLAGFTVAAGHRLDLIDTGLLTVAGPLVAPTATLSSGSIAITGSVSAATVLVLESRGAVTETGAIDAGTLNSGGTTIGGDVALTGTNTIATLAGFTVAAGHGFTLDDTGLLTVAGPLLAPNATLEAGTLSIAGSISAATNLALQSTGDVTETGTIHAGSLSSGGATIGGDVLLTGSNAIGVLAGFTVAASHSLTLDDIGSLTVAGAVDVPELTLSADPMAITGSIRSSTLVLKTAGGITESGAIDAGTLSSGGTSIGQSASFTGTNSIGTLAGFTVGTGQDFVLLDNGNLTVAGPLVANAATLLSDTLAVAGGISASTVLLKSNDSIAIGGSIDTTLLLLEGAGGVTESGTIDAGTLSSGGGTVGGDVLLTGANSIATLAGFMVGGGFSLDDAEVLDIAGLAKAAGITLNDTDGGITESAGGTLSTGNLAGGAAGDVALGNANTIATLDGFTVAPGTLTLDDTGSLGVGNLNADAATLEAAGFTLTGDVSLANRLVLESGGGITQTGGLIHAGTLSSGGTTIGGDVALTLGNSIATLGGFTAAGNFDLLDNTPLDVTAPLTAANVSLATPLLNVSAAVTATMASGTLAIASDGLAAVTPATLLTTDGTIEIAPFTDGKAVDLGGTAAGELDISPAFIASLDPAAVEILIGQAAGRQAGAITIDNTTSFGATLLDLAPEAGAAITDNGTLTADTLAFSGAGFSQIAGAKLAAHRLEGDGGAITGPVALTSTLNAILGLGPLTITGADLALDDGGGLAVDGGVAATDITLIGLGSIATDAPLNAASGGTIDIVADTIGSGGATISAPGGLVAFAPYTGGTSVDFGNPAASAGTLALSPDYGTLVTAKVLQVGSAAGHSGGALTVNGPLTIDPATLSLSGTSIGFDGSLIEPGLVTFNSTGAITEAANAVITAGTLSGTGAGIALGGANSLGLVGDLSSSSDITIENAILLQLAGLLSAPDTVRLDDAAGISELGTAGTGSIVAGTLTGGALPGGDGNVTLTATTNTIGVLGGFTVAANDSFALTDTAPLTVAGPLRAPNATLNAASIGITGSISAASLLVLESPGGISENGGISAGTLSSGGTTIGGDVALTGANSIGTLADFTLAPASSLTLTLDDTGTLFVAGPVNAPNATLSSAAISITGGISVANVLALQNAGLVTETGSIDAATLTSGAGTVGTALLTGSNSIGTLGGFTAGALTLDDAGLLTVAGPLVAPTATLSADTIAIAGSISAATVLALQSPGDITESGIISTGLLTSSNTTIGGDVTLLDANSITALGSFAAAGNIALDDAGDLSLAGLVGTPGTLTLESGGNITEAAGGTLAVGTLDSGGATIAGNVSLSNANSIAALGGFALRGNFALNDSSSLTLAGLLATPGTVTLTDPLGIAESTGAIAAATLNASDPSGDIRLGNANSVAALGTLAASGTIVFRNIGGLALTGPIATPGTVTLEDDGNITETTGAITAGTLDSGGTSIGGDVALANANAIATLGGFTVASGHTLALGDTGPLTITGPVVATYASFTAAGIAIAGSIDAAGQLALAGTGNVTETTGGVTAGTLSSGGATIGGDVALNNANHIGTLGGFAATGGLALADQAPLVIAAPVSLGGTLALLDTGAITQTGGSIVAAALTSDGGTVGGRVSLLRPGNLIPVLGNFAAPAGLALADAGPLDLAGNIFTGTDAFNLAVGGAITQTAGKIGAGTLNAAGSEIDLARANAIGRLGNIATDTLFVDGVAAITGPLSANDATVVAPGDLALSGAAAITHELSLSSGGNITQTAGTGPLHIGNGTFSATGSISLSGTTQATDQLALLAGGEILHTAGVLDAGTLAGAAAGLASFAAGTDIGTLGSFLIRNGVFNLDNAGPLTLVGPLSANSVSMTVQGTLALQGSPGGGLFITGSDAPINVFTPRPGDSVISVTPGANGAAPAVVQTGLFYVNAGPDAADYPGGNGPATLFLSATPAGTINFAPAPPLSVGLFGPAVDLEADVGSTGTIAGNVDLLRVVVLNATFVNLTGFLDEIGGEPAAQKGIVTPKPDPNLRFNACPISSVNCTILPIESLPAANPLQNFDIQQRKKRKLNHNIQLPGIATRDF